MFADQRHELVDRNQKCDRIDESEQAQNNKARQPVVISAVEEFSNEFVAGIHDAAENVQRSTFNVQYRKRVVTLTAYRTRFNLLAAPPG